jgi:hypothetical protein
LSDRRVELADLDTVTQYVTDLHNLLNDSTLIEKKSLIKSFVIVGDFPQLVSL